MASIKDLASETFIELRKRENIENAYNTFTKELKKLYENEITIRKNKLRGE